MMQSSMAGDTDMRNHRPSSYRIGVCIDRWQKNEWVRPLAARPTYLERNCNIA
jgi:hypothetical protein